MANIDGTRDALECLEREARKAEVSFNWRENLNRVGRRGCADDGGQSGRLVLLDHEGRAVRDADGKEIAVQWCHTGGALPNFVKLD